MEDISLLVRGKEHRVRNVMLRNRAGHAHSLLAKQIVHDSRIDVMRAIVTTSSGSFPLTAPNRLSRFACSELLVPLSEKLDQTIHAALPDLVGELLPIGLNQPDAEHVQVI